MGGDEDDEEEEGVEEVVEEDEVERILVVIFKNAVLTSSYLDNQCVYKRVNDSVSEVGEQSNDETNYRGMVYLYKKGEEREEKG